MKSPQNFQLGGPRLAVLLREAVDEAQCLAVGVSELFSDLEHQDTEIFRAIHLFIFLSV
jgi:hypothetical protein